MSADIIQFIPRPKPVREPTDFPTIVFRSRAPKQPKIEDVDTAPSEYLPSDWSEK